MKDLEIIKKYYGENMAHLCRELFPTILESEGLLSNTLLKNFYPSKFLCEDIKTENKEMQFKDYIYSICNNNNCIKKPIIKTAKELLSEAGYVLYECKSESDIQKFKKFYRKDEQLCTFKGNRLNSCHVFFAVKKDVDNIKRNTFTNPKREDEYGTSVISIQFSRGKNNILSIKNRYNHTVSNPDATFSNNLDNIIPDLTDAFENDYGFNISNYNRCHFVLYNYVQANDGKYYKYNNEINNIYYCPDNIIIDNSNVITTYHNEKERYLLFENFILDLKEKTIFLYDNQYKESFISSIGKIEKINITNNNNKKNINIISKEYSNVNLVLDSQNRIIEYKNDNIDVIPDSFLTSNKTIEKICLPNVINIGDYFLYDNEKLKEVNFSNVISIGRNFLNWNTVVSNISLPNVEIIEKNFLQSNLMLKSIKLPKVKRVGSSFIRNNESIELVFMPNVTNIDDEFLLCNEGLSEIYLPNVVCIGGSFIRNNSVINKLNLPNVKLIGNYFLENNLKLKLLVLPNVVYINSNFLYYNKSLSNFVAPKLISIAQGYFDHNFHMKREVKKNIKNNDYVKALKLLKKH